MFTSSRRRSTHERIWSRDRASVFETVNDKSELYAYAIAGWEEHRESLCKWFTNRFTVHCFARNSRDKLMWEKYGDHGRGICLGLDIETDMLYSVEYFKEVKVGSFPAHLNRAFVEALRTGKQLSQEIEKEGVSYIRPFLLTKFDEWSKESELRAFDIRKNPKNGHYFDPFSEKMYVQEVVLGSECPFSEAEIRELVAGYPGRSIEVRRFGSGPTE